MFVKISQVSADEGMGKLCKLVEFSTQKRFHIRTCVIGSLSNDDGDVKEKAKKQQVYIRWDYTRHFYRGKRPFYRGKLC